MLDAHAKTPSSHSDLHPAKAVTNLRDAAEIWQDVEIKLKKILGERVHKSWTGQLSLTQYSDQGVSLTAPSKFVVSRIDNKYGDLLRNVWTEFDPRPVTICAAADIKPQAKQDLRASKPVRSQMGSMTTPTQLNNSEERLVARFTFDNFVVGPSNELAVAGAKKIAHTRDTRYNPMVIFGPNGMGKTHLLYAIYNHIRENDLGRTVKFVPAEKFVASFVRSVRAIGRSEIEAFKAQLRTVDVLIIDDAHFITDKPGSQEELLHTLIALVENGKQVVLATDRPPHAIEKAQERLKSYLSGGLVCDIGPADYELRLRILDRLVEARRKSGHPALSIPQNVRDMLAARINATPRDLEGAFNQVVARLEFLGRDVTLESVEEALAQSRFTKGARPTVERIQRAICKHYKISLDELHSKGRARAIARPRQIAMYLCKNLTTRSLPDIGRRFGGRDHTTVIHAIKRIGSLCEADADFKSEVEALKKELDG